MPEGQNTDAFTKYLRRRADTEYTHPRGPGEPMVPELLREAAHRLELIGRTIRVECPFIEDGLDRDNYISSEEEERVAIALIGLKRILAIGCGGIPDGQLTLAAGQVPQPGPAAAPRLRKHGPHGWWYE